MAAATVGQMEPFNPDSESIVVYLKWIQLYFEAYGIKAEKQVPVFLNIIGRENYGLLRNLSAPNKLSQESLNQLMDILKKHFEPKKVVIAARFQFHQRQQQPGETIAMFLAELQRMAVPCEFGNVLSESLRDHLVCGLAPIPRMTATDAETESPAAELVSDVTPVGDTLRVVPNSDVSDVSTSVDVLVGLTEVPVSTDTQEPRGQLTEVPEMVPGSSVVPTPVPETVPE